MNAPVRDIRLSIRWGRGLPYDAAGEYLGVSASTVRALVAAGDLPEPVYIRSKPVLLREHLDAYLDRLQSGEPEPQDTGGWD